MDTLFWTIGDAAKHTGKSKSTISKYVKNGTISYIEKTAYSYKLDPSEVLRVFGQRKQENGTIGHTQTAANSGEQQDSSPEIRMLREQNAQLEAERKQERERAEEQILDLRRERDQWQHQADHWRNQATALLMLEGKRQQNHASQKPTKTVTEWLRNLFG